MSGVVSEIRWLLYIVRVCSLDTIFGQLMVPRKMACALSFIDDRARHNRAAWYRCQLHVAPTYSPGPVCEGIEST